VARLLVMMGSGETTPTMVATHQRVLDAVRGPGRSAGDHDAVVIDTPYGFQENADEISARTTDYFARRVGHEVGVLSLRDAATLTPVAEEAALATVREARWVFAGPGSPSYLARTWLATRLPDVLRGRLAAASDAATVLASAAACTIGAHALPVYEIYKVGVEPHWQPGLDLLAPLGLDAVVVPHFDNAEGGTHDTRYCYMGERRLTALEDLLPATTWVLGIDEHTAAVVDLEAGSLRVEGRGSLTVRARDVSRVFATGSQVGIEELLAAAAGDEPGPRRSVPARTRTVVSDDLDEVHDVDPITTAAQRFEGAIDTGSALAAAEITLALESSLEEELASSDRPRVRDELRREVVALARLAQIGLHEHRDLVAPHVELLLALREGARSERRFAEADAIRDALVAAGVEVRDGVDGSDWTFHDPLAAARAHPSDDPPSSADTTGA